MSYGWLVVIAIRVALYWATKNARAKGVPAPALVRFLSFRPGAATFSLALRAIFIGLAFACVGATGQVLTWQTAVLATLVLPQVVLSGFLIPLGVPRLTYAFARVTFPFATAGEPRGGSLFNELRARLSWNRALAPAQLSTMDGVLLFRAASDKSVRGASLCVQATLDALSGQRESARDLFALAQSMNPRHAGRSVRAFAQAWLLADAAERGAYHELRFAATRGPRTVRCWFLRKIAQRLLGEPASPTSKQLWAAWLLAPGRRHTLPLLRQALATPPRAEIEARGAGLASARRATLELERAPLGMATRAELRRLACAWQAVFDSGELTTLVIRRRDELHANFDADALAARFEQDIIGILARAWRWAPPDDVAESDEPFLILSAKDELQSQLLGEVESLCSTLPRGAARTTDDLEQHIRNWARVRSSLRAFLDALPEREALLFASVGLNILNHGAWLYNKERARILGHDVFRFLIRITPKNDPNRRTIEQNLRISQ